MGDVVEFKAGAAQSSSELAEFEAENLENIPEEERRMARLARHAIYNSPKVQGKTRNSLAENLGRILSRFGRELSRDELVRTALKTDNIKPSERLGKYQIIPGKKVSDSKRRSLSKSPKQYLELTETAARMTGRNEDQLVLELVEGTRFDPRLSDAEDIELKPAERISDLIRASIEVICRKYPIASYVDLMRRYKAEKICLINGDYEFKTQYDNSLPPIGQFVEICTTPLFSILLTTGYCEWRVNDEQWIRRKIDLEERVRFSLYIGPEKEIFGAFSVRPSLIFPRDQKSMLPQVEEYFSFPKDFERPWITGPKGTEYFLSVGDDGAVDEKELKSVQTLFNDLSEIFMVRLPNDHGLDLSLFERNWADRIKIPKERKESASRPRRNHAWYTSKIDRVSVSSVSKWLDRPISSIRRSQGDAFWFEDYQPVDEFDRQVGRLAPKHDPSRGISPPDTMLAEVEVSLFYDGYQGRFDDQNTRLIERFPVWETNENDEPYMSEEEVDLTYDRTFLQMIENDVKSQIIGFSRWRNKIHEETLKRAGDKFKQIDETLTYLKSRSSEMKMPE